MNLISLERLKKALESFYDRISGIFATKSEMTTGLNKKSDTGHSHNNATVTSNGYMSKDDKAKLDGIASSANNYTHPSTHAASMITQDSTHRFVTDTEKSTWNAKASTSVATTSANGLMSSSDKTKLDGIAEGAQVNADITKAEIEAKLTGAITSHTHKYAGSSSAGGAATSATKLANARNITIGNKTNSFNGTAAITYTLADIGAANASEVVLKGDSLENIETNLENLLAENGLYQGDDITTIDYTLESTFSNKIGALSNLNTTTKTSIVDAINEVFQSGNNVKGNLVDALVAKGIDISTSESWDNIITAVRDFSGGLSVIAASSLPSNGSENQICVITDSPTTNIVVTHNDTFTASGDEIVVYLRDHVDYLTPISITSGGVTNDYYIDYVLQNGTSCEAYVYQSGNWNKVVGKCIFLLKNGTAKDITWHTAIGTYFRYMAGTGVYLSTYGSSGYYTYLTTNAKLTKNYSKARVKGVYTRGQTSYNYKLYVGGRESSVASYTSISYATYSVNTTLPGTGQTYASRMIDMEFDISSLSLSNNYFIVQLYAAYSTQMGVTITDIILVE